MAIGSWPGGYWPLRSDLPEYESLPPTTLQAIPTSQLRFIAPSERGFLGREPAVSALRWRLSRRDSSGQAFKNDVRQNPLERWCADFHPGPDESSTLPRSHADLLRTDNLLILATYCALTLPVASLLRPGDWGKGWWWQCGQRLLLTAGGYRHARFLELWRRGMKVVPVIILGLGV